VFWISIHGGDPLKSIVTLPAAVGSPVFGKWFIAYFRKGKALSWLWIGPVVPATLLISLLVTGTSDKYPLDVLTNTWSRPMVEDSSV
jgi:hypothetical protein